MKTKEEIEQLAKAEFPVWIWGEEGSIARYFAFEKGYTQCQEDMTNKIINNNKEWAMQCADISKECETKWTFDEILDACYPTLGRGSDWATIVIRLKEQKANKQD